MSYLCIIVYLHLEVNATQWNHDCSPESTQYLSTATEPAGWHLRSSGRHWAHRARTMGWQLVTLKGSLAQRNNNVIPTAEVIQSTPPKTL